MSLIKHGKTWHCHFVVNGQRFRQSLGTKDWPEAQAKEKELIGQAMEGKLRQTSTSLARQPFGQAADDYQTARKLELAEASRAKEKQLLVPLRAFFKQEPLKAITAKRISRRMLERYSHVRMEAKRTALEVLAVSSKTAGYDTSRDTNQPAGLLALSKLLRDLVDLVGIEPTTSSMPWKRAPSCATGPLRKRSERRLYDGYRFMIFAQLPCHVKLD